MPPILHETVLANLISCNYPQIVSHNLKILLSALLSNHVSKTPHYEAEIKKTNLNTTL